MGFTTVQRQCPSCLWYTSLSFIVSMRWRSVVGVSDHCGRMCSKSSVVLVAFHHSAGHFCSELLEDHLDAPTPRQGRGQSTAAARCQSINFYCSCLRLNQSFKTTEQDTEKRHQDNDRRHLLLRCLLAACPVHDGRPVVRLASIEFARLLLLFRSARFRQSLCPPVHLCYRHVSVSNWQVRCRASSSGA